MSLTITFLSWWYINIKHGSKYEIAMELTWFIKVMQIFCWSQWHLQIFLYWHFCNWPPNLSICFFHGGKEKNAFILQSDNHQSFGTKTFSFWRSRFKGGCVLSWCFKDIQILPSSYAAYNVKAIGILLPPTYTQKWWHFSHVWYLNHLYSDSFI